MPVAEIQSRPLIDEDETARRLGLSAQTLCNWRCKGRTDLPFVRVGRAVRYRPEDVERFISENTVGANEDD